MVKAVVQDENMLCARVINESNSNGTFLKTRFHSISSPEALVCLSHGVWDEFPNVIANKASG
jgi:hypothetical protein